MNTLNVEWNPYGQLLLAQMKEGAGCTDLLSNALKRIVNDGMCALRKRDGMQAAMEKVAACCEVIDAMGRDCLVVSGDDWEDSHADAEGNWESCSVDIILPVKCKDCSTLLLVEGKMGCTSKRNPTKVELEEKFFGTSNRLHASGVPHIDELVVLVSSNVRHSMKHRIGNWMRGTHRVDMVSFCLREFILLLGALDDGQVSEKCSQCYFTPSMGARISTF